MPWDIDDSVKSSPHTSFYKIALRLYILPPVRERVSHIIPNWYSRLEALVQYYFRVFLLYSWNKFIVRTVFRLINSRFNQTAFQFAFQFQSNCNSSFNANMGAFFQHLCFYSETLRAPCIGFSAIFLQSFFVMVVGF